MALGDVEQQARLGCGEDLVLEAHDHQRVELCHRRLVQAHDR